MGQGLGALKDVDAKFQIIINQNSDLHSKIDDLKSENVALKEEVAQLTQKLEKQSDTVWNLNVKLKGLENKYKGALRDKEKLLQRLQDGDSIGGLDVQELAHRKAALEADLEDVRENLEEARSRINSQTDVHVELEGASRDSPNVDEMIEEKEEQLTGKFRDYKRNPPREPIQRLQLLASMIQKILEVYGTAKENLGESNRVTRRLKELREDVEMEGKAVARKST